MKRVLYYFPHAGAAAANFKHWNNSLSKDLIFIPIDYSGRGTRHKYKYYSSINEAVEDIYSRIKQHASNTEGYYFCGQCLGSIIAYELYYKILAEKEISLPNGLIFIGQGAPDLIKCEKYSSMKNKDILQLLNEQGNIDKGMLNDNLADLVEALVINPLKADSLIYENYYHSCKKEKISVRTHILYGEEDNHYSKEDIERWDQFIKLEPYYYCYEGAHNICINHLDIILKDIKEIVLKG
ncbi:thioesterase II family protein [Clostridium sp. LP20]|uniref:thioesterase II family protein n=1 Tax=Clostridium sp. LP20 TaxID=3418665 RepID=UPI003EE78185